jgi:hypothetical protein
VLRIIDPKAQKMFHRKSVEEMGSLGVKKAVYKDCELRWGLWATMMSQG